jgi:cytochrome c oxidase cbb3-type subunit I/II
MSMTLGRQPSAEPEPVPATSPLPPVELANHRPRLPGANVRAAFLIALPLILLLYVWLAARGVYQEVAFHGSKTTAGSHEHPEPAGIRLYAQHCSRCHGLRGTADGATSPYLDPPARRFGEEKFMLSSTENGIPTDADLDYVLRHGIPGTAMPPFDYLTDAERKALAAHIRWLTRTGVYARLYQRAKKQDPEDIPDVAELSTTAAKQSVPGPAVEVSEIPPPPTPESIARGGQMFTRTCATCHGPKGAGDGPQVKDMKNEYGRPTRPRDLARGVFKGGGEPERLYVRIANGMPGSAMPGSKATLKPDEIWDLVYFVRSLSEADLQGTP